MFAENTFPRKTDSIFPFFWQHGEDHETLLKELEAIRASGCSEFCVESRTHEEFCRERWWDDFGFLLEEAEKRGMRIWLLDDKRFPTGYAVDYISSHPELRRKLLRMEYRDVTGPVRDGMLLVPELKSAFAERLLQVCAMRRGRAFDAVRGKPLDLNPFLTDSGYLRWSVPSGTWRIYYLVETLYTGACKENYVDVLSRESSAAMLHAVYEPHYEHFHAYFGGTFRGFFSDEPSFANSWGSYHHSVGTEDLLMPWRPDLPERMAKNLGVPKEEILTNLPALWHTLPFPGPAVRCAYMDEITKLYRENFSYQLGDWCRAHSVLYIGHVIEDMNTHQRLGYGPGHFFRALEGQDMGGIDVVLHQLVPGNGDVVHTGPVCGKALDPHFFQYALAKLGASLAHLYPQMRGRAMCEIFGAFGWAEGVGFMKYLADHMLASGINHFVPHAFSPKYPDPDCPPQFHAGGHNPQEPAFGLLMRYMQRASALLSDGTHAADAAVLYNAEAEWTGGKFEYFEETCLKLTRNQLDFDILPEDLLESARVEDGALVVNGVRFPALLVPASELLPRKLLNALASLSQRGLPVLYLDRVPRCADGGEGPLSKDTRPLPAARLTETLRKMGIGNVRCEPAVPGVRVYCARKASGPVYMLLNELKADADFLFFSKELRAPVLIDLWSGRTFRPETARGGVRVRLAFGQALFLTDGEAACDFDYRTAGLRPLRPVWNVSLKDVTESAFRPFERSRALRPLNVPEREQNFSGSVRYEAEVSLSGTEKTLELGRVGEIATVTLNGVCLGTLVSAPYRFDLGEAVRAGKNDLRIEVIGSPAFRERAGDELSTYLPVLPTGLQGPVKIG